MASICEGWSVLELGTGSVAASLTGMLLADNGARVLKIEPPTGDRLRTERPSGFLVWNRGKESLVADLDTDEGRSLVREAALHSDVLVAGVPAGRLERWGLDDDDLRGDNPALVHCSITGFGPTGPYAAIRGYEAVVAAKTGLFSRGPFGFRDGPIFYDAPWASLGAAHSALAGILAALMVRERTGRGQRVDATLAQGITPLDYFGTMHWQYARTTGGAPQVTVGTGGAMAATRTAVWQATADGRFITTTYMLPHEVRAVARAVGIEQILDEPRFAGAPKFPTAEDAQDYEDAMWDAFRTKSLDELLPVLRADRDIAFETAVTSEQALDHPQVLHNGEVVSVDDPRHGRVRMIGPVARFASTPSIIDTLAPDLDANDGSLTGPAPVPGGGEAPQHALSGVTIVECGFFYAMPLGPQHAAALGARVVKIEGRHGDPFRLAFGAPETTSMRVMEGKESLAIDLQHPSGREVMHRLIADADVFVTSFRPGVPERLGLGYDTLKALNPKLVYVHAAGYGCEGPYSDRAMYATAATAAVGGISRHAAEWLDPAFTDGWGVPELQAIIKPRLASPVDGDSNAALSVLSAIMLGLTHQRRTGEGQHVSLSMLGGNALCYSDDFCAYDGKAPLARPDSENHGLHALYRLYRVADGWVFLAAPTDREWADLVKTIDATQLAADERFATAERRLANDGALVGALSELLATRPGAELEATLTAAGVGCVVAFEGGASAFTSTDPVLLDTDLTVEVDTALFGRIRRHGLPVALSETPGRIAPSCLCGEHTESILAGLGYSTEEIETLTAAEAVFTR